MSLKPRVTVPIVSASCGVLLGVAAALSMGPLYASSATIGLEASKASDRRPQAPVVPVYIAPIVAGGGLGILAGGAALLLVGSRSQKRSLS